MQPVAIDGVAWSVCMSVCVERTGEPCIGMPFGELDPRNHVLDGSGHCRHLVNTSEQFVLGGDVSLCQITLTTCVYLNASDIC